MPRNKKVYASVQFQIILDALMIILATNIAMSIRFGSRPGFEYMFKEFTGATTFSITAYILFFFLLDMYGAPHKISSARQLYRIGIAAAASELLLAIVFYFFPLWKLGRGTFILQFITFLPLDFIARQFMVPFLMKAVPHQRILLFGDGPQMAALIGEADKDLVKPFEVVAVYRRDGCPPRLEIPGIKTVESRDEVVFLCKTGRVDRVVVDSDMKFIDADLTCLLECRRYGAGVLDMPVYYTKIFGKIPIEYVNMDYFIYGNALQLNIFRMNLTRLADFIIAFVGLIISLPIIVMVSLLVKATSRGPVFYMQERVGLNNSIYKIIKFRTMHKDAEKDGPKWAGRKDPRVTLIGKYLRRTRIDELPQLLNVLKGEMGLIGPRPERPVFVDELCRILPYYRLRHLVKPGVTGWAQVRYKYGSSYEDAKEKLKYDLYFIKESTIFDYVKILFRTAQTVFSKPGS